MSSRDVHPKLESWRQYLNQLMAEQVAQGVDMTPEAARQGLADMTHHFTYPGPEVARADDLALDLEDRSIPLRYFQADSERPKELILFIHGGGHMAGSVDVYDPICRRIAHFTQQGVLSIDYRLAPENPWPCGLEDVRAVMAHLPSLLSGLDLPITELNVHIMGDSGGGAMAATVCLQPDTGLTYALDKLVLIYPSLDYRMETESVRLFSEGYLLTAERMQWYFDNYLQGQADPLSISPLEMPLPDYFPQTLIINAGFDPLRDEAELFKDKLVGAGLSTELSCYPDMLHAFLNLESMVPEVCDKAYREIADFLR